MIMMMPIWILRNLYIHIPNILMADDMISFCRFFFV